jgi:ethanolamine utilization protein EutP
MMERKKRWRFMLWGGIGAGKTTLLRALQGGRPATKTQMIEFDGQAIDTPGEYSEMGRLRRHLQTTAAGAQLLLVVHDATREQSNFPPNYFLMYQQPVLGVVTKIDAPAARPQRAIEILRHSGITGSVFCVSALTGSGMEELGKALAERREQWRTEMHSEKRWA